MIFLNKSFHNFLFGHKTELGDEYLFKIDQKISKITSINLFFCKKKYLKNRELLKNLLNFFKEINFLSFFMPRMLAT